MDNFSLFEALGIEVPETEPKQAAGKKGKKETKPVVKKEEKLVFPLTVVTGVCPATVLTEEQVKGADTLEKVADFVCEQSGMPRYLTIAKRLGDSKIAVVLDREKVKSKGEFDITEVSTVLVSNGEEVSLHEICGARTAQEINEFLAKKQGEDVPYQFISDKTKLYAVTGEELAVGNVSLPVHIKSPLGDVVLTVEDFDKMDDDGADGKEVSVTDIEEKVFASAQYTDVKEILALYRPSKPMGESILYLGINSCKVTLPKSADGKKEETYPTDAVISMIFHRIQLTPEMFGGKKRVTEKGIIEFLSKDYPEFTMERTKLTYDKKGNFIFPSLKSSSKGAMVYASREECMDAAEKAPVYFLANYLEDGREFRYEKTPVMDIEAAADGEDGCFRWKLPPVPQKIFDTIREFFAHVTHEHGTEALVWLVYFPEEGKYDVIVPEQEVDRISVYTEAMTLTNPSVYHVADIHSHNSMNAFFSPVDDADEMGNQVYGVMGRLDTTEPEVLLRAGTGGKFVQVGVSDIFGKSAQDWNVNAEGLYEQWISCVRFK